LKRSLIGALEHGSEVLTPRRWDVILVPTHTASREIADANFILSIP
jgi:hypothetical protein